MRLTDAVVGAGLVFARLATSFATAPERLSHANEFRFQFQSARPNGRPTVSDATAAAAPVADRHDREHVDEPTVPAKAAVLVVVVPIAQSAVRAAPTAAVRLADHQPGVAGVVVLPVAGHQPVHVRRQRGDQRPRRHHQTAVGRPPAAGDRGGGQDRGGTGGGADAAGAVAAAAGQAKVVAESVRHGGEQAGGREKGRDDHGGRQRADNQVDERKGAQQEPSATDHLGAAHHEMTPRTVRFIYFTRVVVVT